MTARRIIGVDLGQANDYTALAILDRSDDAHAAVHAVRHVERFERGTPYPRQVERIGRLRENLRRSGGPDAQVVVDQTGVGRPVVDMLRAAGIRVKAVTITGGDVVTQAGDEYRVPKRDLVSAVQVLLQSGRLKIASGLPRAQFLVDELLGFKMSVNAHGHDSYGNDVGHWRETQHDDLVLAVALASWFAEAQKPLNINA